MTTARELQIEEAIQQRATEWFVRHREGELTNAEQREYLEWLRASPRHVDAYLKLITLSASLPEAMAGLDIDASAIAERVSRSHEQAERALFLPEIPRAREKESSAWLLRWSAGTAAIAMASIAVLIVGVFSMRDRLTPSIVVPPGQQRVLTLADGSIAHLNSGARLIVRYTDTRRLLQLSEGQGLFTVMHDARRPFIVRSGPLDVVATGTKFDVMRGTGQTQVTVVEGRIEIIDGQHKTAASMQGAAAALARLGAGEQVSVADQSGTALPIRADVDQVTAWSRKEVRFDSQRLDDVAAQFSQYTGVRIAIDDARLRDYRISGVLYAYDLDSFLAYLRQFDGVTVERRGGEVHVRATSTDLTDSISTRENATSR